jgi:hypothetical protein
MKSWKTTAAGIAMILTAVGVAITQFTTGGFAAIQWEILVVAISGGIAAILAKDFNVSNAPVPGAAQTVLPAPKP